MASAITYTDGTNRDVTPTSEGMLKVWVSPATMDSADTVILPTVTGKTVRIISCWDNTTGDAATASISTQTVTIDVGGSTTDHVYVLTYMYV